MGCRGSEVQILSCRPKIPKKTNHYGWFFYICNQFDKQTVTHHSLFIFCYQNVQTTPA